MTIYILFGEMGSGKNFIGQQLATYLGCSFYDGDDAFPPDLQEKIKNCVSLRKTEVRAYVKQHLIPAIDKRCKYENFHALPKTLVVAQALYIQSHRDLIAAHFGDNIVWVHIKPPSFLTHMRRLLSRKNGIKWMLLGLLSKSAFQGAPKGALIIKSIKNIDVVKVWKSL